MTDIVGLSKTYRGHPNDPLSNAIQAALELNNWHVYQMNDCDWVAAPSADEAVTWYLESYSPGFDADEILDTQIIDCPLDTECWADLSDRSKGRTTYGEIIAEYLASGKTDPFVCASTEY